MKAFTRLAGLGLILASTYAPMASAEQTVEYPDAVPLFLKACVEGELTASAREAVVAADSGWAMEAPTVDVSKFGISRAIDRNFDFSKPLSVKQWTRTVNGATMRLVLATLPEKRRYTTICALITPAVRGGWPYNDTFKAGVRAIGLKGKSTDLPHYFEYSGKVQGTHAVRAEIFGRTQAVTDKDAMHLYIAF